MNFQTKMYIKTMASRLDYSCGIKFQNYLCLNLNRTLQKNEIRYKFRLFVFGLLLDCSIRFFCESMLPECTAPLSSYYSHITLMMMR